ncbi:Transient receptor potential cation channel protein painless, partial [Gryllus bimaculatus]
METKIVALLAKKGASPDAHYPSAGTTLLCHACSEAARDEYVRALLRAGADPNLDAPALVAARSENFVALELLLLQPDFDVNTTFADGGTILHVLFRMPCKVRNTEKLLRCIEHVLNRMDVQVNRPDCFGMTPIMYAVELYQEDRVQVMLKQSKHKLNLDVLQPNFGKTTREFILKRFFDLKEFLPPQVIEDLESPDPHVRLLAALQHRRLDLFKEILQARDADDSALVNPNHWYDDPYYCTCLELACRINGCEDFVQELLDAGADPTAVSKMDGTPLVHFVLDCCNYATLQASYMNVTALHMAAVQKSDHPEASERGRRCVELLLSVQHAIDVNVKDGNGDTPLHYAVQYGCKEVVLALLRRGANMMVKNNNRQPPVHLMAAHVLEEFLDEQVDSNDYSSRTGCYTLIFKYGFLQAAEFSAAPATPTATATATEMEPLLCMTQPHLRRLLQHPVLSSYLYLKWTRVRMFFYMNIIFYTVFVIALTAFILLNEAAPPGPAREAPPPPTPPTELAANGTAPANDSDAANDTDTAAANDFGNKLSSFFQDDSKHAMKAWLLVVIFFFGYIINEIFQMFMLRLQYFRITSNYMSLLVITVTGIVITHHWIDDAVYKHLCAIAILISWVDLVLISGRLPTCSIHLEMLKKVTSTFLTFMTWYFLLIIAFALCFHTLFFKFKLDSEEVNFFHDPFLSMVKTIAMFAGELSIASLPFSVVPGTSHVVFVVFVFLIAIVLLNLLNGLAVYDTQAIKENARVLSLVSLVRLVASIERTLLDLRSSAFSTSTSLVRFLPDPRLYQ